MDSIVHSPFLQALGYAIINSLWQFALLWLLYFSVNTIFKLSSHQKYLAGLMLEFAGFVWFAGTLLFYYKQSLLFAQNVFIDSESNSFAFGHVTTTSIKDRFFLFVFHFEQFFPYLSIAYLALLVILGTRWIWAYRYTQQVRYKGITEIDTRWQSFVQNLSMQLGIRKRVTIFLSRLVDTPLTIGFLKPVILIPLATVNYLNQQQMEAVILHELAHIKRFDYIFNLALALIEACLFFNPFMRLIQYQVKKERENCCDDWVLKYDYSASAYAHALLQIASKQGRSTLLAQKATENKHLLLSRVKRIIEKKEHALFNYKYQLLALLVMTMVFSLLSLITPAKKVSDFAGKEVLAPTNFEPIAATVSNPLFNPVFFLASSPKIEAEFDKKISEIRVRQSKNETRKTTEERNAAEPLLQLDEQHGLVSLEDAQLAIQPPPPAAIKNDANRNKLPESIEEYNGDEKLQNLLSKEVEKLRTASEKQSRQFRLLGHEEKNNGVNPENIQLQLKKAIDQINLAKKEVELSRLHSLARIGIRKIRQEKQRFLLPDENVFKTDELEAIQRQLESAIDSVKTTSFFRTTLNTNVDYNFQFPRVLYRYNPDEKEHTFSYDYRTKARVKVLKSPVANGCDCIKQRKEKVVVLDDNQNGEEQESLPAPPPPKAVVRVRSLYIIRI